ncbi:primosomal protein N' [bacterium]|nr:primosomal protein N' [bacterium]
MISKHIASVAINIPKTNLFSYSIPPRLEDSVRPGHLVCVPLRNKEEIGLVVDVKSSRADEPDGLDDLCGLKDIKEILALPYPDPVLDRDLLDLARWISDYYLCPIGVTIRALIPAGVIPERISDIDGAGLFRPKGKERLTRYIDIARPVEVISEFISSSMRRSPKQSGLLKRLIEKGGRASISELYPDGRAPHSIIKALTGKGIIKCRMEKAFRNPYTAIQTQKDYQEIILTDDQQNALNQLSSAINQGGFHVFLLYGITGSGKTEVYLRLVMKTLEKGRQAIILAPEISITHQLIDRFKYYLSDRIAIMHSHLSDGERLDEWLRIRQGLADVVIGARSAVFAPMSRLGVIICDEEHDPSYKQNAPPRYNGRDVAIMRAKMSGCMICLGSATPSLETYYNASIRKYRLLCLPKRVTPNPPPPVKLIDMREEFVKKGEDDSGGIIFSKGLLDSMRETLDKAGQVLIFQNRRGYSPFMLCPRCGFVPKCPNCSVSLTYHSSDEQLRCHYCDFQRPPLDSCPHCPETPLKYMGHGTQKLERELKEIFTDASIARMDRDTTSRKGAHHRILSCLEQGETDILVGTQMVTKGLDLPKITTVGVIGADYILNLPDFRSTERAFQMITQVAGRAGRGDEPGKVLVQTFYPNHYSLSFAAMHDYISFYNREIGFRKRLFYPPFSRLLCLIVKGKDKKKAQKAASFLGKYIKSNLNPGETPMNLRFTKKNENSQKGFSGETPMNLRFTNGDENHLFRNSGESWNTGFSSQIRVLGPSMAPIFRIRGMYRYQIMLKAKNYKASHALVRRALEQISMQKEFGGVKVDVDVDPVNLL